MPVRMETTGNIGMQGYLEDMWFDFSEVSRSETVVMGEVGISIMLDLCQQ